MENSGLRIWLILSKAYGALREHAIRHIESEGLGLSDFAVLETILHKGPQPVNTIGSVVRLTSGSITAAVDRLENKGLVERAGHPTDRRTRLVHLTPPGRQLIKRTFAAHREAMSRAASGLTAAERAQTTALLKRLGLSAQEMLDDRARAQT